MIASMSSFYSVSDDQDMLMALVFLPLAAYLIAATPFGVLIARFKGVNLRTVGSGNVGATNVGRTVGKGWGYLCFFLDMTKGCVPTLLAGWLIGAITARPPGTLQQGVWLAVGAACVMGHVFPFWLKFHGGKGVATSLGVVLGMFPYFTYPGLAAFATWIVITLISRYVSLGSVLASLTFLVYFVALNALFLSWREVLALWPLAIFAAVMTGLILVRHRANIHRLLNGTENKIGSKSK